VVGDHGMGWVVKSRSWGPTPDDLKEKKMSRTCVQMKKDIPRPLLAIIGLHWPLLAFIGRHWLLLAFVVGRCWPLLVAGLCGSGGMQICKRERGSRAP
jgi:hypothetical protein